MPTLEYECNSCKKVMEVFLKLKDIKPHINCNYCNSIANRVILTPPGTVIPPSMQAIPNKLKYYGVKNPITGEGITPNTDVSSPPGIKISSKGLK